MKIRAGFYRASLATVGMVMCLWGAPAYAAPGDLDPFFGDGGKVTTDFFGGNDAAKAIAIQKNRRIVVAGFAFDGNTGGNDFALARYRRNGSLDQSFGHGGKVTAHFFGGTHPQFDVADAANALAIQADGRIVAAGVAFNGATGAHDFGLLRFNSNGNLDRRFGIGGMVATDFGGVSARANGLALQPDGKLVVVGSTTDSTGIGGNSDFALARYHPNGRLDKSFGAGGKVVTDFTLSDEANAVHLTADGKILVAGSAACIPPGPCASSVFVLLRYNPNGSLDTTFGNGGQVTTNFFIANFAMAIDVAPDGKIVLAGITDRGCPACSRFLVARYNADGSVDTGFGDGGIVTTVFGDIVTGVNRAFAAVIREGKHSLKIVVGGFFQDRAVCGNASGEVFPCDFALARYNEDGSLDESFGSGGKVTTDFGGGAIDRAFALAIQNNGKIVLAGSSDGDFALARYLAERCKIPFARVHLPTDDDDDKVCK